jgi:chemotaxis protein CheY-P-specific phosphatase CheC
VNQMKAEDIINEIENMENGERIRTLEMLFHKYFDNRPPKEVIEKEKIREMWGEDDE